MPLFSLIAFDKADSGSIRADTRPRHLDHLAKLGDRVFAGGPMLSPEGQPIGSLVIAEFPDLGAAQAFAEADPYNQAGLFDRVTVAAWRKVLPSS